MWTKQYKFARLEFIFDGRFINPCLIYVQINVIQNCTIGFHYGSWPRWPIDVKFQQVCQFMYIMYNGTHNKSYHASKFEE